MYCSVPSRRIFALLACASAGACASVAPPAASDRSPAGGFDRRAITAPDARAAHVLGRMTFGPRPGDVERVVRMGIDRWIAQQLASDSIVDRAGTKALDGCWPWLDPLASVTNTMASPTSYSMSSGGGGVVRVLIGGGFTGLISRDSALRAGPRGAVFLDNAQLIGCRLARVEASDQQLVEVMTDFWENHFSVYGVRMPNRGSLVEWDRGVIRPRALGRFRDILGAVAVDPGMLSYLDNAASGADSTHVTLREYIQARESGARPVATRRPGGGLNENYGRELLELHTMGVDGGYTQADVIDVARAFTGWSHTRAVPGLRVTVGAPANFRFDSTTHDADPKVVLGHSLAAGRGLEDGEQVLDILARHPSTARFIARKLAVRFVSDDPPAALVERAAETFRRTDGDIREVVRTIVTSREFNSPDVYGAKVKNPLEFVLSIRRVLAAPVDTAAEVIDFLVALDHPPFGRLTPDGWPETGPAWATAGAIRERVNIAFRIANGEIPSIPVTAWPEWARLSTQPFDAQLDGVIRSILSGRVSAATRSAMASAGPAPNEPDTPEARQLRLRELIAMALGSPEFQRR
jgi:uncharacterized protein (DUF1800 family)